MRRIGFERQHEVNITYKGHDIQGQRIDILVEQEVVIELKSVSRLPEVAQAQTLSYLKATALKRALLINVGENRLVDGITRLSL